jgi:hypothetical protein
MYKRRGYFKFLYKLKINEAVLLKRNINVKPTAYIKELMEEERKKKTKATVYQQEFLPTTQGEKKSVLFQRCKESF